MQISDWVSKQKLVELFTVIDGKCSCGRYKCQGRSPGKHPTSNNGLHDAKVFKKLNFDKFNYGLLCGDGLLVIDIDKKEGINGFDTLKDLESKLGKLPDTITVNTGSGGMHLYFRTHAEIRTQSVIGIDIRSNGSYVVVPPSKHWTGEDYEFEFGKSPEDIEIAEFPNDWVIHFSDIQDLNKKNLISLADPVSIAEAIDALNAIDPDIEYTAWISVIAAAKHSGVPFEEINLWCSKGQKYKGKYEVNSKYNSLKREDGLIARVGTIFHVARQNGWEQKTPELKLISKRGSKDTSLIFPTIPNDAFGDFINDILQQSYIYDRNFALGSAVSTISAISIGGYKTFSSSTTGIYGIFPDYFGGGKKYYLNVPMRALHFCKNQRKIDSPTSNNALLSYLSQFPARAWIQDEAIDKLKNLFGGRNGEFSQDLPNNILALWTNNDFISGISAKDPTKTVESIKDPSFTFIGAGVKEDFEELLNLERAIKSGLLSRLLAFFPIESIVNQDKTDFPSYKFSSNIIDKIRYIDSKIAIQTLKDGTFKHVDSPEIKPIISNSVRNLVTTLRHDLERKKLENRENGKESALYVRSFEQLSKLSSLHAIWLDPDNPVVSEEIFHFWSNYIDFHRFLLKSELKYSAPDIQGQREGRVLATIEKHPNLTPRDLHQKTKSKLLPKTSDLKSALDELLALDKIVIVGNRINLR